MALSINQVFIAGHLGADPEEREAGSKPVVNMRIATNEGKDRTEWHSIVVWDEQAIDYAMKFLHKGDGVVVVGRLQTRKWQDREGNDKYTTEIVANRVQGASSGGGDRDSERSSRGSRDRGRDDRGSNRDRDRGYDRGRDDRRASGNGNGRDHSEDRRETRDIPRDIPRDTRDERRETRDTSRDDRREGNRSNEPKGGQDLNDEIPF